MIILKIEPNDNGSHDNQVCGFALPTIPGGWAVVPPELEAQTIELLPWVILEMEDGEIIGVSDNAEDRAAADAEPTPEPAPTPEEQLRADVDYIAIMTGVVL